nr:MAG TPA: hypothetical protein [Myoviridae sp. ctNPX13]
MLGTTQITQDVSMSEHLKQMYKLPFTDEQISKIDSFFASIHDKDEHATVHFTVHSDVESFAYNLTLHRYIEIDRMLESLYTEDLVFSLNPVKPGVLNNTMIKTHHLKKVDAFEYPDVDIDPNMEYNVAVVRTVEYYIRKAEDRVITDSINYDIIILNTHLDVPMNGIIFEDLNDDDLVLLEGDDTHE